MASRLSEASEEGGEIAVYTTRRVRAGAELTLDYALEPDDPADYPCHCGARACRGTMAARSVA